MQWLGINMNTEKNAIQIHNIQLDETKKNVIQLKNEVKKYVILYQQ